MQRTPKRERHKNSSIFPRHRLNSYLWWWRACRCGKIITMYPIVKLPPQVPTHLLGWIILYLFCVAWPQTHLPSSTSVAPESDNIYLWWPIVNPKAPSTPSKPLWKKKPIELCGGWNFQPDGAFVPLALRINLCRQILKENIHTEVSGGRVGSGSILVEEDVSLWIKVFYVIFFLLSSISSPVEFNFIPKGFTQLLKWLTQTLSLLRLWLPTRYFRTMVLRPIWGWEINIWLWCSLSKLVLNNKRKLLKLFVYWQACFSIEKVSLGYPHNTRKYQLLVAFQNLLAQCPNCAWDGRSFVDVSQWNIFTDYVPIFMLKHEPIDWIAQYCW